MSINRPQWNSPNYSRFVQNRTGNDERTQGTKSVSLNASVRSDDYDKIIKDIYDKSGIQGLLDYLNTLDKCLVTNIRSEKNESAGTWTLTFTINGKNYTYVENKTAATTQTTPAVSSSGSDESVNYEAKVKEIAKNSGIEGLKEYLNSLDKSLVTYMNTVTKNEGYREKTYLVFTLDGKNHTFMNITYGENESPSYAGEIIGNSVEYDDIVNGIYKQDGLEGLLEYLESLDKSMLTFYAPQQSFDNPVSLIFTLCGRSFKFEENWPADSSDNASSTDTGVPTTAQIHKILSQGGMQGLLDYLDTLDDSVVSDLRINNWLDNNGNRKDYGFWSISFSINGKPYSFKCTYSAWPEDEGAVSKFPSDTADDFDLKDYAGKVYVLNDKDEEAVKEEIKRALEESDIKEQFKEKFLETYYKELLVGKDFGESCIKPKFSDKTLNRIFETNYNSAVMRLLNDLPLRYEKNENGENVLCIKFEDVIDRLLSAYGITRTQNTAQEHSVVARADGQEIYRGLHVKYEVFEFELNDAEDEEIKREKMKNFLMQLKDQFAKAYNANYSSMGSVDLQKSEAFAALFEGCVDAVINELVQNDTRSLVCCTDKDEYRSFLSTDLLVYKLNKMLGERLNRDTLQQLFLTPEEKKQREEEAQNRAEELKRIQMAERLKDFIKNNNLPTRKLK